MDLEKTADKNLEMGSSLKFVYSNIYIDLLPVTEAYEQQKHTIDYVEKTESLMETSSHTSGESPKLSSELEKSELGYCHNLARLAMHQSPDPGGHTALAQVDPRFVPQVYIV